MFVCTLLIIEKVYVVVKRLFNTVSHTVRSASGRRVVERRAAKRVFVIVRQRYILCTNYQAA